MRIENTDVYDLEKSIRASRYPMSTLDFLDYEAIGESDYKRGRKLGKAPSRSGHDCFLKGIGVRTDIRAPQYFWLEFQRYHFADFVSSQSKMHRITNMDLEEQCNEYVDNRVIQIVNEYIKEFNENSSLETFQKIVSNVPMGLELTARITTNYLQLKTMYEQRKNHKLEEWHLFCEWCKTLPMFLELTHQKVKK